MAKINANYDKLATGYLEIARVLIPSSASIGVGSCAGIGDTTEPIVPAVLDGLHKGVTTFSQAESYCYPAFKGVTPLREAIAALIGSKREVGPTRFRQRRNSV